MKTKISILALSVCVSSISLASTKLIGKDFTYFTNHFMTTSVNQINNSIDLLFVENAKNASLVMDRHKNGCMVVKLWPVTGDIHYFANEPVRRSGSISPENFVNFWQKQNTTSQQFIPNVDIEGILANHNSFAEPAALSDASYDASGHTMSYIACPLVDHKLRAVAHMYITSIFFDGFHGWPPI